MKTCTYCGRECEDNAVQCSGCGLDEFTGGAAAPDHKAEEGDELVVLTTCQKLSDADLIRSKLDAAGIEAIIPDENLMQAVGFNLNTYGFVRVQVRQADYAAAKDLLATVADAAAGAKPDDAPAAETAPAPAAGEKRVIASLNPWVTDEVVERLKTAGIPFELKTATDEGGLEMSEIVVEAAFYDRGCDVVEAWSDEKQAAQEKRLVHWCRECGSRNSERVPHETLGFIYRCKDCGNESPY